MRVFNKIMVWCFFSRIDLSSKQNCAYLSYRKSRVYSENCDEKYPWICEKASVQLT